MILKALANFQSSFYLILLAAFDKIIPPLKPLFSQYHMLGSPISLVTSISQLPSKPQSSVLSFSIYIYTLMISLRLVVLSNVYTSYFLLASLDSSLPFSTLLSQKTQHHAPLTLIFIGVWPMGDISRT